MYRRDWGLIASVVMIFILGLWIQGPQHTYSSSPAVDHPGHDRNPTMLLAARTEDANKDQKSNPEGSVNPNNMNPYTGDTSAIETGNKLYSKMNCYACHGREGGGGMGPSHRDAKWRYGAGDTHVFQSIKYGRPNGMPGFGQHMSDTEIWKLVAFLRTFHGGPGCEECTASSKK